MSDQDPRINAIALARARTVGAPLIVMGMAVAFAVSIPSGIPLTTPIVLSNLAHVSVGALMWRALASKRVPTAWAHPVSAGVWMLAPSNTLVTLYFARDPNLTLPFILELALACVVQVSPRWLLVAVGLASAAWVPLILRDPGAHIGVQLLVCDSLISTRLRRSLDDALRQEEARAHTAAELVRELEERRRVEREREGLRDQFVHAQRLEATGTLAAGLAHDMNNILGAIMGQAQLIAEDSTNDDARAELGQIVREAERGASLTRSLLAFSRQGQYTRRPMPLDEVLRGMETLLARTVSKRAVIEWNGGTAAVVDCDPAQMRQVLVNLCINAADAIEGSRGLVRIESGDTGVYGLRAETLGVAPGRYATFSVADTGSGMTPEVRARIFEPFFTTKPLGRGTGLGLAMVHGTVAAPGGAIEVDTAPGRGSIFRVLLPITEARPATESQAHGPVAGAKPARLVLVVDDEPLFRQNVVRVFQRLGHEVISAADGAEAIATYGARADEITLVVLDMSMPVMDGPECFERLRAIRTVPILLVSGYTDDAMTQRLIAQGAARFLEKPFRLETLRAVVAELLASPPV